MKLSAAERKGIRVEEAVRMRVLMDKRRIHIRSASVRT
jgi:hypothetical protein